MYGYGSLVMFDFYWSLLRWLSHIRSIVIIFLAWNVSFEAFQIIFCASDSSVQMHTPWARPCLVLVAFVP